MSTLADLRALHRGPVIEPSDRGFEAARTTFNGMLDRRPELITQPLDTADAVTAVKYAREAGLPVAVRGGGHGVAGHCVGDGSLVVDLRLMREVAVDPEARTASVQGGALWDDVDPVCQRHGLAMPGGTFGDTGVAGLTLGGGIGHLSAKHGLTLDNLVAVRLVTAAGEDISVSEDNEPELFWALRGGGGNFGVVTEFTFRLHPVGPLYGGSIDFNLDDAPGVLRAWRDLMGDPPDGFQSFALLYRSPFTGLAGVNISVTDLEGEVGPELVDRLVGSRTPVAAAARNMGYPELQNIYARMPFGLRNYWSGRFLRTLADEVLDLALEPIVGRGEDGSVLFEPFVGAVARVSPDATAFAGRDARWNATFTSAWVDPSEDEPKIELARAFSRGLAPWALAGGYLNYAVEASADGLEAEFGAYRFERLRAVKRAFDPDNVFRFNHNISPD